MSIIGDINVAVYEEQEEKKKEEKLKAWHKKRQDFVQETQKVLSDNDPNLDKPYPLIVAAKRKLVTDGKETGEQHILLISNDSWSGNTDYIRTTRQQRLYDCLGLGYVNNSIPGSRSDIHVIYTEGTGEPAEETYDKKVLDYDEAIYWHEQLGEPYKSTIEEAQAKMDKINEWMGDSNHERRRQLRKKGVLYSTKVSCRNTKPFAFETTYGEVLRALGEDRGDIDKYFHTYREMAKNYPEAMQKNGLSFTSLDRIKAAIESRLRGVRE